MQKTSENHVIGKSIAISDVYQYFRAGQPGALNSFDRPRTTRQKPERRYLLTIQGGLARSFTDFDNFKNMMTGSGGTESETDNYIRKLKNGYHMKNLYCMIMAGGSGTRFWPRSRTAKPKQYLDMFGEGSLLESTIKRFSTFTETENIYIVSNKNQATELEKQTPELPRENLIYEPVGKNTLPCIGLAAMFAEKENPDGIMVVSPSDHLVNDHELFRDTVLAASKIASEKDGIVTIGIKPTFPATGYGYVKTAEDITGPEKIRQFKVDRFVEKPELEKAKTYLKDGGYFWNSGLFVFKVSVFLEAVREFAPGLYSDLRKIQADIGKPSYPQTLDEIYRAVESISVDYGIMEHARNIYMVEGNFDWNDLGSWESVYQEEEKDENGNASNGESIFLDAKNSYVFTDEGLVALVGLDDVIVVRDGNATLVCKKENAQDVKKIVDQLKAENKNHFL